MLKDLSYIQKNIDESSNNSKLTGFTGFASVPMNTEITSFKLFRRATRVQLKEEFKVNIQEMLRESLDDAINVLKNDVDDEFNLGLIQQSEQDESTE